MSTSLDALNVEETVVASRKREILPFTATSPCLQASPSNRSPPPPNSSLLGVLVVRAETAAQRVDSQDRLDLLQFVLKGAHAEVSPDRATMMCWHTAWSLWWSATSMLYMVCQFAAFTQVPLGQCLAGSPQLDDRRQQRQIPVCT